MFLLRDGHESLRRILFDGVNTCSAFILKFHTVKEEARVVKQVVVPLEEVHAVIVGVVKDIVILYSVKAQHLLFVR